MKNRGGLPYLGALAVFAVLLFGLFIARNTGGGLQVEVSRQTVTPQEAETEPVETEPVFPINLNTADLPQLEALPGIGPVLAERILQYREEVGGFSGTEELLQVEGIGEKRLEDILDYIMVEGQE